MLNNIEFSDWQTLKTRKKKLHHGIMGTLCKSQNLKM